MRLSRLALAVLSTFVLAASGFACTDPVPPTSEGAFSAHFSSPGGKCGITGHDVEVGSVTSATATTPLISDGPEGAVISCQVSQVMGSNSFSVEGDLLLKASHLAVSIKKIDAGATKDNPAPGSVTFGSSETVVQYASTMEKPCSFYFIKGSGEGVASGRLWAAFSCNDLENDMSICSITESYVLLQNCTE